MDTTSVIMKNKQTTTKKYFFVKQQGKPAVSRKDPVTQSIVVGLLPLPPVDSYADSPVYVKQKCPSICKQCVHCLEQRDDKQCKTLCFCHNLVPRGQIAISYIQVAPLKLALPPPRPARRLAGVHLTWRVQILPDCVSYLSRADASLYLCLHNFQYDRDLFLVRTLKHNNNTPSIGQDGKKENIYNQLWGLRPRYMGNKGLASRKI